MVFVIIMLYAMKAFRCPYRSLSRIRERLQNLYSGWWVLAGVTALGVISGGILYHGAAIFFNPIRRDLNLSSASASLIFTISRVQSSLAAPLYGWLVDRFGPRPLIVLGAILAALGMVAITFIDNYLLFLITYVALVSVPANFGFGPTLMVAANGWFARRKAIAMTILLTGIAAGGAIFLYPLGLGVSTIGWRATLIYAAIFVLVSALLLSRLVRAPPDEVEAVERLPDSASSARASAQSHDFSLSEAFRTGAFWILLAASTLRISAETGLSIHIIPIMVWQGAEEEFAAGLVSLFFLLSIPFRLSLGMAGHRLNFQPLIAMGMFAAVSGCVLLIFTESVRSLYLFVALLAIYEGSVVLQWIAVGNYFGRRNYGAITGIMRASDAVGSFLAPWFAGWMFDRTQSYVPALTTFAVAFAIAALLYLSSRSPRRIETKHSGGGDGT